MWGMDKLRGHWDGNLQTRFGTWLGELLESDRAEVICKLRSRERPRDERSKREASLRPDTEAGAAARDEHHEGKIEGSKCDARDIFARHGYGRKKSLARSQCYILQLRTRDSLISSFMFLSTSYLISRIIFCIYHRKINLLQLEVSQTILDTTLTGLRSVEA